MASAGSGWAVATEQQNAPSPPGVNRQKTHTATAPAALGPVSCT